MSTLGSATVSTEEKAARKILEKGFATGNAVLQIIAFRDAFTALFPGRAITLGSDPRDR